MESDHLQGLISPPPRKNINLESNPKPARAPLRRQYTFVVHLSLSLSFSLYIYVYIYIYIIASIPVLANTTHLVV